MVATIDAEDGFDRATRASPVLAPALIRAGRLDRFHSPALFEETAALIRGSQLHPPGRRCAATLTASTSIG